jgi:hypothetical protein
MKKLIFILGMIVSLCDTIQAQQSTFYDAMFIYEYCYSEDDGTFTNKEGLYATLQKYYKQGTVLSEAELRNNPFFKKYVPALGSLSVGGTRFKEAASSIGSLNVTNFADGLAKFLVARAKEELNVAFFRKFQEFILGYPEVITIFPNTYDILSKISSYQYTTFLPALRAGFNKDMNDFSAHFIELRDLKATDCNGNANCISRINSLTAFLNANTIGKTFVAALIVSDNLVKGTNPAEILDAIEADRICFGQIDNFSNIIRFSNLMSNSLRSKEPDEVWVQKDDINSLVTHEVALNVYLGMLYQTNKLREIPISFSVGGGGSLTLENLLKEASTDDSYFAEIRIKVREVGNLAAQTSQFAKNIRSRNGESSESSIMIYADYATALSHMLKQSVSFFNTKNPQLVQDVSLFTTILDDATDACYDIKSQNYTSLVLHTSDILNALLKDEYSFKDNYIKYGTFMAGIIEADNSDEVKAAIEAAVLPVGSSSIKRETFSNISLNAYLGPMAGSEYLGASDKWSTVLGVTAPLGVAFNWGNYCNGKRNNPPETKLNCKGNQKGGNAFTLFIPLIDVGSIATFRLNDESSEVAAEIKLENIIAPGLYAYWGLAKVPISIGLGGQVGPQLREVTAEQIDVDKNFYFRIGLNVVVDIPFFNFYTRN